MKTNNIASSIRWLDVLLLFSHLSWEGTASTGDRHDDKQITHHTDVDQHSGNDSKQTECRLWFDSVYLIYILMWRRWQRLPLIFAIHWEWGSGAENWIDSAWLGFASLWHRLWRCLFIGVITSDKPFAQPLKFSERPNSMSEYGICQQTFLRWTKPKAARTKRTSASDSHTHTLGTELNW